MHLFINLHVDTTHYTNLLEPRFDFILKLGFQDYACLSDANACKT